MDLLIYQVTQTGSFKLHRTSFEGLESTKCTPVPPKKWGSRHYTQGNKDKPGRQPKVPDKTKSSFIFGLEISKIGVTS